MSILGLIPIDFIQQSDPRIKDWFFSGFLTSIIFIPLCYFYAVFVCIPRHMKHRKPYELKTFLIYYNIFQVIANASLICYGLYKLYTSGRLKHVIYSCGERDKMSESVKQSAALFGYHTLLLKIIDLSETVVFALRKKREQISVLHVYHHISVLFIIWSALHHYEATHFASFPILLNMFVHVVMYSYYLTTNLNETRRKFFAPFKRYLTLFQMVQFVCILLHLSQFFLIRGCDVPESLCSIVLVNVVIYFGLFFDFYRKNYKIPKKVTQH